MKGLKIRAPPAKIFVETWKTLGASPTPMVWGEVYLGLKQGLIDTQENPFAISYHAKIYEVTDQDARRAVPGIHPLAGQDPRAVGGR